MKKMFLHLHPLLKRYSSLNALEPTKKNNFIKLFGGNKNISTFAVPISERKKEKSSKTLEITDTSESKTLEKHITKFFETLK